MPDDLPVFDTPEADAALPSWDETSAPIDREKRKLRAEAALGKAEEFVADLGQRAAYTVSQMRPDIALSRLVELPYEIDRALGLVPKESPNPLAQPVVSPEQMRKAAEFVAPDVATIGQFGREAVGQFARPGVQLAISAPPEGEIAKAIEGAKQFGAEFASGLTTPANVAAMAAAPTYPEAIGRTFQTAMIAEAPQAIQNAIEAAKSGDTTQAVKGGLAAATTVGLPLAIERGLAVKPNIYERENLPVRPEIQPPQTIPSATEGIPAAPSDIRASTVEAIKAAKDKYGTEILTKGLTLYLGDFGGMPRSEGALGVQFALFSKALEKGDARALAAIRLAQESAKPQLKPAIKTMDGDVIEGKAGETHNQIIADNDLKATEIDRRGFTAEPSTPQVPAFAAKFDPETFLQRPAWVEPGSAFDKVLGDLRESNDPLVGKDVTGAWKSLTTQQRQDLAARGWVPVDSRIPGQVIIKLSSDAVAARNYFRAQRRFLSREQAAAARPDIKPEVVPATAEKPAELHSTDLPEAKLKELGWTDEDIADLKAGGLSVSQIVERKLQPFEGGGGPDHAKALAEARMQAVMDAEQVLSGKAKESPAEQSDYEKALRQSLASVESSNKELLKSNPAGFIQEEITRLERKKSILQELESLPRTLTDIKTLTRGQVEQLWHDGKITDNLFYEYAKEWNKTPRFGDKMREGPLPAEEPQTKMPPPSTEAPSVQKQPWEMTRQEYYKNVIEPDEIAHDEAMEKIPSVGSEVSYREKLRQFEKEWISKQPLDHELVVSKAISEGKPVPPEVLKDYPDLAKTKEPPVGPEAPSQRPETPAAAPVSEAKAAEAAPSATPPAIAQGDIGQGKAQVEEVIPPKTEHPLASKILKPEMLAALEEARREEAKQSPSMPESEWMKSRKMVLQTAIQNRLHLGTQAVIKEVNNLIEGKPSVVQDLMDGKPITISKQTAAYIPNSTMLNLGYEKSGRKWVRPESPPGPGAQTAGEPPKIEGMGGATAGEKPIKREIEQLTDAFRGIEGSAIPLPEKIKQSFNLGEKFAAAKDGVSRAVSGLKTATQMLTRAWDGIKDWDDIKRIKGELSAEIQARGWRLKQFEKQVKKAMPSVREREAIASWIDSGGDEATLRRGAAESKEHKRSYEDALKLTPEQKLAAENIKNYFESRLQEAMDEGVIENGIEDYIHRIFKKNTPWKRLILNQVQSGVLNTRKPGAAMRRVFDYDFEAEKHGYRVIKDFLPRILDYEYSISRAIADRKAVKKFMDLKMEDGRPMIDVGGIGVPIEDPSGVRETTLIKPQFKPGDPEKPGEKNYRKDYLKRDYPALRKWKWATKDESGNPILVQGDVLIHPDAISRVDAMLEPSAIRKHAVGRAALGASSTFKQTMLDFSGFHQVQIGLHAMEHRVFPGGVLKDIDLNDPKVQGLLKGGLNIGGDYKMFDYREGLVGRSLSRQIPGLGQLMQTYHEYLFQDYIPRVKTTMALHALERNRAAYKKLLDSGKMTEEQLNYLTAKQANAAFGELNYIVMERSQLAQDISRLIFLAPDFLEARSRFAAQGLGGSRFGREQRMALLGGALALYVTARIINKLLDDQYHFEPENAFSVVYKGNSISLRTVQGDLLHLWDKPFQFWLNRLNPVFGRSFLELGSGRDYFGRKRTRLELIWDLASNAMPISLRSSRERKLWESMANAFGMNVRRWSDVDKAFKLAQEWKAKNGVQEKGEFIYDSEKDPLRPLKITLSDGDEQAAAIELKKLVQSGKSTWPKLDQYFNRYQSMPFTGSKKNDIKFQNTLTTDQRKTLEVAKSHRRTIRQLYWKAKALAQGTQATSQLPTWDNTSSL